MKKKAFKPCEVLEEYTGNQLKELPLSLNVMKEIKHKKESRVSKSTIKSTRQNDFILAAFYKPVSQIL
ncbi:hypothetical protein SanaruYs_17700 [Chryseotalea sanaruensis]|uniref:Uncharacterized protein n=1 Tax=Chryseotalea sanaruensis TaxID=2482724 RepID=A0A401U9I2_9BACT|nr:hypothetical protein [Chryseotalea sanaruensis]GCC51545.1 hypothetical protein SanaruYs_17700 [Chryseotalea sanaruensis]